MPRKKRRQSIEDRLLAAQVAIDNSLNLPGVSKELSQYGYDKKKIELGKGLYNHAVKVVTRQKAEYGDQFEATKVLKQAWDVSDDAYMSSLKVSRVAFRRNKKAASALRLTGLRKVTLSGWISEATLFYTNLLADPALLKVMGAFGYTKAKLTEEKKLVDKVVALNAKQEKEKGEAQSVTKRRERSMDRLDAWMSDFRAIARVALEDKPQWLEKIGIKEES